MSNQNPESTVTFAGSAAINQYTFVYQTSGNLVTQLTTDNVRGAMVSQTATTTGAVNAIECAFEPGSFTMLYVDNAYAVNAALKPTSSGFGTAATTGCLVSAIARQASTAEGDCIVVQLTGGALNA